MQFYDCNQAARDENFPNHVSTFHWCFGKKKTFFRTRIRTENSRKIWIRMGIYKPSVFKKKPFFSILFCFSAIMICMHMSEEITFMNNVRSFYFFSKLLIKPTFLQVHASRSIFLAYLFFRMTFTLHDILAEVIIFARRVRWQALLLQLLQMNAMN